MDWKQEYKCSVDLVEKSLNTCFTQNASYRILLAAMRYSLLAGGKRIRPVLVLKFCEASGGDSSLALPFACAVEMIHTYSLIHDDLPCMDNDDLRRGRPTNHKMFGEYTATLAGDALQAAAFETLFFSKMPPEVIVAAGRVLATAAGQDGMCGGQYLDMAGEGVTLTLEGIKELQILKTGALLRAACIIGVSAAGKEADNVKMTAAEHYASAIGLAFQIRDDILDRTATAEALGKSVGSDAASGKATFVSLLGVEACQKLVLQKTEEAKTAISGVFEKPEFLCRMADQLASREK